MNPAPGARPRAGTVDGAAVRSRCARRPAGHVMQARPAYGEAARCYWCNETLDPRDRIAHALAVALRHLPDIEAADLAAMPWLVSKAEDVAAYLADHSHAGADDAA